MPYTLDDARAAVAKGVKLLDEKKPGWREKIKPECLVMDAVQHCVLGQSYGTYYKGTESLFADVHVFDRMEAAANHGFDVLECGEDDVEFEDDEAAIRELYSEWYAILDQAWREELTKQRPAGESAVN